LARRLITIAAFMAFFTIDAAAQVQTRRASITGNRGDDGKCTLEVRVDVAAEVEISGDMGRIRTLGGQPASWVRFDCSGALPRNPSDFRFKGIDGRGRVDLVRDPQSNRGIAVVRIEDPKGGSESYTFDLEWRGGSDYNTGRSGGFDRRDDDDYRRSNGGGNGRGSYNRGNRDARNIVTCGSNDGRRNYCDADTRNGVSLLEQHSDRPCREGSTWGYDRRGIWVDRGCRADFEVRR
jgi:hypothetical protein